MTLSDLTNNIYIFNLKRRTDRREHIISEMDKIDCKNYQIIEAVDGRKINNNSRLKNGAFGLIMSYILLYDTIKDIPYDNILIIEDDCVFYENFNVLLSKYISQVPSDWDILYFGANHNYHIGYKTKIINDNVVKLEQKSR